MFNSFYETLYLMSTLVAEVKSQLKKEVFLLAPKEEKSERGSLKISRLPAGHFGYFGVQIFQSKMLSTEYINRAELKS